MIDQDVVAVILMAAFIVFAFAMTMLERELR